MQQRFNTIVFFVVWLFSHSFIDKDSFQQAMGGGTCANTLSFSPLCCDYRVTIAYCVLSAFIVRRRFLLCKRGGFFTLLSNVRGKVFSTCLACWMRHFFHQNQTYKSQCMFPTNALFPWIQSKRIIIVKGKEKKNCKSACTWFMVHGSSPEAFWNRLRVVLYKAKPLLHFPLPRGIKFHKADCQHAVNDGLGIMLL